MNADQTNTEQDEIEGLGQDVDSSWSDYPIDTLLIRNENRTVHDVLRRIEKGTFVMDPDFQRDFIWPDDKQCKLIESVLMRIPLPVFYLAEDDKGRMIVVDGLQRLSTFNRFVNNDLQLKLPGQIELHGKRFKDLSPKLQNRVEDCNLILYVIDAKVPERAKLDIFERVNSGMPLTRQQMRNCLYMGPATLFLKEESGSELFKRATGSSLNIGSMRDREFINRFCAFQLLTIDEYKGDMDDFLAKSLLKMNSLNENQLQKLSSDFRTSMANNYTVFGRHAFRKSSNNQPRSLINASLWDVLSTGLTSFPEHLVEARSEKLKNAFLMLMSDETFKNSISYGTNDLKKVKHRFSATQTMLKEVFDA